MEACLLTAVAWMKLTQPVLPHAYHDFSASASRNLISNQCSSLSSHSCSSTHA
jgi:hypothetical protein